MISLTTSKLKNKTEYYSTKISTEFHRLLIKGFRNNTLSSIINIEGLVSISNVDTFNLWINACCPNSSYPCRVLTNTRYRREVKIIRRSAEYVDHAPLPL